MSDYAAIEKEARIFTEECVTNNRIDPELFAQYDIKRGLRDKNGKGVLARVASTIASAGADITHVNMSDERAQLATDLRFAIAVKDRAHLADVLRALKRTTSVLRAQRVRPGKDRG